MEDAEVLFAGAGHNMRALSLVRELTTLQQSRPVVVLLGSLQNVFEPLFEQAGAMVVLTSTVLVDHSKTAHLTRMMDKEHYIDGYLLPTFLNFSRILEYLAQYQRLDPSVVVSEYNLSASIAALLGGYRHVLVTERYDFSLAQISDDDFRSAGFDVHTVEMAPIRPVLTAIFDWIVRGSELVLTDKPPMKTLDEGTALFRHIDEVKVRFFGPMTRRPPLVNDPTVLRADLGLGPGPVIVASVGGTTMFMEDKSRAIHTYREAFALVHHDYPDAQMVLIGRTTDQESQAGITFVEFLPDWMALLTQACVLISQPGWITVTEIATLKIPTIFILAGRGGYHEIEAQRRLGLLGFPTLIEPTTQEVYKYLRDALRGNLALRCSPGFEVLAPTGRATVQAAELIEDVAK